MKSTSRIIAGYGQADDSGNPLTQAIANLQANAEAQAQAKAVDYANQLYEQYQTQIWIGGVILTGWILWVSWAALHVTNKVKPSTGYGG